MNISKILTAWGPFGAALVLGILLLFGIKAFVEYREKKSIEGSKVGPQLTLFLLSIAFIIMLILISPINETTKGQLLSLIGILLTAAIALSSTTFLGNIMAGFMIRALRKFDPGDYLRIDEYFGRVTVLGLLHTEIQLEDRDLAIIPNLHLVTRPMKIIHTDGTLLIENVSLGYDIPNQDIEAALLRAAKNTGLEDSFVHIQSLGDFSVVYRIAGFLKDTKRLISTHARLRKEMLESLHASGIEIVSPTFMNQRVYPVEESFVPSIKYRGKTEKDPAFNAEDIIFDKAEKAESLENLKARIEEIDKSMEELKLQKVSDLEKKVERLQKLKDSMIKRLESHSDEDN